MNWNLIFKLSLFGLAMGIATVFFIPSNVEPFCWLIIFIICAIIIAKRCEEKYFYNGVCVSLVNSVWITAAHILMFTQYSATHAKEIQMMRAMPLPTHPRIMMLMTGPVIGVMSGMVLGLFSYLASLAVKKRRE